MDINTKAKGKLTLTHILLIMVCFAAMNVINAYYYFIIIAIGIFCLTPHIKVHIDPLPVAMLLILAVAWVAFSPSVSTSIFSIIKPFIYVLCYILGSSLLPRDTDFSKDKVPYKLFYLVVLAIASGTFIHYLLNWLTNIGSLDRNTIDFWTGTVIVATGQASLACIPMALSIACLFSKSGKRIKIVSAIVLAIVMLYNLILSGRTLIFMALGLAVLAFMHRFLRQKKGKVRLIIITVLVIFAVLIAYQNNLFGIKTVVEDSPIYDRFFSDNHQKELDDDVRMDRKMYYINEMENYLWGGTNLRKMYGHAHDIFLDTYDEAGIFAFIGVTVYMLVTLVHLLKCLTYKSFTFEFRQIVLCIYVAIYLEFMIEPILQGIPWLFALFCLIDGYVSRLILHKKHIKNFEALIPWSTSPTTHK